MYQTWKSGGPVCSSVTKTCFLSGSRRCHDLDSCVVVDMHEMGVLDGCSATDIQIGWDERGSASILGVRFNVGEPLEGVRKMGWQTRRCGSVFTAIVGGVSRYGVVKKFIERVGVEGSQHAIVDWFPFPMYPFDSPLVVCVRDGDPSGPLSPILSIRDMDPCGVCVERCDVSHCSYLYRLSGLDTVRT